MPRENLSLGARWIVLFNLTDCLEQFRTERVVQELWEKLFRRLGKAFTHVAREVRVSFLFRQIVNDKSARGHMRFRL